MHGVFEEWNKGELDSYLHRKLPATFSLSKMPTDRLLFEKILDTAGQKGTGKWTSVASLDLGIPLTMISEAVYGRCLSASKEDRVEASKILQGPKPKFTGDKRHSSTISHKLSTLLKLFRTRRLRIIKIGG